MAIKKKTFEHDSLQDLNTIVRYLNAITEGVKNGKLELRGRESEINLEPHGLVRLELRASERPDRARLDFRLTWKPKPAIEDGMEPLEISSSTDTGSKP